MNPLANLPVTHINGTLECNLHQKQIPRTFYPFKIMDTDSILTCDPYSIDENIRVHQLRNFKQVQQSTMICKQCLVHFPLFQDMFCRGAELAANRCQLRNLIDLQTRNTMVSVYVLVLPKKNLYEKKMNSVFPLTERNNRTLTPTIRHTLN